MLSVGDATNITEHAVPVKFGSLKNNQDFQCMGWGGNRLGAGRPKGTTGICGGQRKALREKFYRFALKNHKQFFESLAHTMFVEKNSKVIMWFGDQLFGKSQPIFDDPSDQQPMDFQTWIMQAYEQVDEERRLKAEMDKPRETP